MQTPDSILHELLKRNSDINDNFHILREALDAKYNRCLRDLALGIIKELTEQETKHDA